MYVFTIFTHPVKTRALRVPRLRVSIPGRNTLPPSLPREVGSYSRGLVDIAQNKWLQGVGFLGLTQH